MKKHGDTGMKDLPGTTTGTVDTVLAIAIEMALSNATSGAAANVPSTVRTATGTA